MMDVTEPASLLNDTQQAKQCPSQLAQTNKRIQLEPELLLHLLLYLKEGLEEGEEAFERDLIFFGIRIFRRIEETTAYCEKLDNMINSFMHAKTATCKIDDLDTMLEIIKLAKEQEQDDIKSWCRFYDERQAMLVSMGRSQKQPITKKKNNHNRNKNKNRSKKKKEKKLLQDESMETEADVNEENGALPDNIGDLLFEKVQRAILKLGMT